MLFETPARRLVESLHKGSPLAQGPSTSLRAGGLIGSSQPAPMNFDEILQQFAELLRRPPITWWDALDILIVSILIYELLKLIRGTRAVQMAVGIASIVGLFYLSRGLQLETLNWLIRNIIGYVVFAAI